MDCAHKTPVQRHIMNKNKTTANLSQKYLYINNNESIICYDKSTHEIMNNNKNVCVYYFDMEFDNYSTVTTFAKFLG